LETAILPLNYARKELHRVSRKLRFSASRPPLQPQDYARKKAKSYPGIWNSF